MALFLRKYRLLVGTPTQGTNLPLKEARDKRNRLTSELESGNVTETRRAEILRQLDASNSRIEQLSKQVSQGTGGYEITENRITFRIVKSLTKNPNKSDIEIYNLAPQTRAELEKTDVRCFLYAGYEEDAGPILIYQGNVTFCYTRFEGTNVITVLELGDGAKEYRDTNVTLGYEKGVDSQTILRDIAAAMGLTLTVGNGVSIRKWESGFSFYGPARTALDKVVRGSGSQWSIQNGILQVIAQGGTTSRSAVVISADSGMIGYPDRMREGAHETATLRDQQRERDVKIQSNAREKDGWRVKSLLIGSINPGDRVKLESRSVQAVLVPHKVSHSGDSEEGDWQTELELVTLSQANEIVKEDKKSASKSLPASSNQQPDK